MYDINYDDDRFKQVEQQKQNAITEAENTYNGMIAENDRVYQEQKDLVNSQAQQQQDLQQQQHDLAMEQLALGQQKQEKAFEKEQRAAYVDYQKQSENNHIQNIYNHLNRTGYDSSSDRAIYSAYQSRLDSAFQTISEARTNYDIAKKDAVLQNSSALLKIAQEAAQKSLELTLQQFQYKNTLITELFNQKQTLESEYYGRYQDVLSQINTENELAEKIRQYNEQMAYQKERDRIADEQWQKEYELSKQAASRSSSGGGGGTIPVIDVGGGGSFSASKNPGNNYGNTYKSTSQSDYYFTSNGYQPRYINDAKVFASYFDKSGRLSESSSGGTKLTAGIMGLQGVNSSNTVWATATKDGLNYWVWLGKDIGYANVTSEVRSYFSK